jgi:hypothetical protein
MDVSPSQLRRIGATLHDLAAQVRASVHADRAGPAEPGWATDTALGVRAKLWDEYLTGLAVRLAATGDGLVSAAEGYEAADSHATVRLGRRLC